MGEIQKAGLVQDWWWISGELNVADILTGGGTPAELNETSMWQDGPAFLSEPIEKWPSKSAREVVAHDRESVVKLQRKAFTSVVTRAQTKAKQGKFEICLSPSPMKPNPEIQGKLRPPAVTKTPGNWRIKDLIKVEKVSSLSRLVNVVAWVRQTAKNWLEVKEEGRGRVIKGERDTLKPKEREDALRDLFHAAQEGIVFPQTASKRLVVFEDAGLLVCVGRIQAFDEDRTAVPVIPYEARLSTLIAREAHEANHKGIAGTLLRMRKRAWIIKGRRLAEKVVNNCVVWRKATEKQCKQIMSDLPLKRTNPANVFEFTTMDLFGPYKVKDEVRRRVTFKVWGIAFCCMSSRAVHTDIARDQSSEGFLLAYQRFTSFRGHPKKLWSDSGTNFVRAKPPLEELQLSLNELNKTQIEEEASRNETEWSWRIHPADSPHRNGAAEVTVCLLKRALSNITGDGTFTWIEFQTVLFMAANLVNERPIDARI